MKDGKIELCMNWLKTYRFLLFFFIVFALVSGVLLFEPANEPVKASSPTGDTITATVGANLSWTGDRILPQQAANGEPSCTTGDDTALNCDVYTLTVAPGTWSGKRIKVGFNWATPADDYDMVVRQEDNGTPGMQGDGVTNTPPLDPIIGSSGNGTNTFEEVIISPTDAGGIYYIRSVYFGSAANQYTGSAVVESTEAQAPASGCAVPTFDNYQPPVGYPRRDGSGEPSIGVNWNTGNVMTMSRLRANTTRFDDSTSPAHPTDGVEWISRPIPGIVTGFDPILFTDPITGRSIGGELVVAGGTTQGGITDNDFETISATFQTGGATQGVDHQTIGGGPPNESILGRQPVGAYPHLFYYASQSIATATVSTSFDGGLTYQPAVPAYTLAECNGLHGHIKVAPDGTVYLPNKGCGGKAGFSRSTDNGLTWEVKTAPLSTSGNTDPSVAIGAGGKVYFAYSGGDNRPHVAISDDRGDSFPIDYDLSQSISPNLTASVFMHAVAGDNDRAMIFFLATDSTGTGDPVGSDNDGAGPDYQGTWFPYVAYTCDGGVSWSVTKADNIPLSPGVANPVQQGVVCTEGTLCPDAPQDTRNLLDFNEAVVDSRGRMLTVYADGCGPEHPCSNILDNSGTRAENQGNARLTIIRQRGGMRLFGAFDPGGPAAPSLSPPVEVKLDKKGYALTWATPDNNGSPLTGYRIYRGGVGESERLVTEVKPSQNRFTHNTFGNTNRRGVYYRVTAVNKFGESPRTVKFFLKETGDVTNFKNASDIKGLGE